MTITLIHKEYKMNERHSIFIEKYCEKYSVPMWRYGILHHTPTYYGAVYYAKELLSRPNTKKVIERLSGMV